MRSLMRFLFSMLLLTCCLATGCTWFNSLNGISETSEKIDTNGYTEKDFFNAIQGDLKGGFWQTAIDKLRSLEAQYPFGDYAEQAQLELIYAHFRVGEHVAVVSVAERFIRLHPQHPNVDYAYYLKGLSSFVESDGMFGKLLPMDETKRDPGSARNSFSSFSELLNRFPESQYAPDAQKRMIYMRNILARHEVHAANYFLTRGAYLAAANRGRYIVENFQKTPAVPDGLAIMAQAYHLMEVHDLSNNAAELLAKNYPNHPVLDTNGKFQYQSTSLSLKRSWTNTLTAGLFDKPESLGFDSRHIFNERYKDTNQNKTSWISKVSFGALD
jgi:outer membrane protein assembly factor BamD